MIELVFDCSALLVMGFVAGIGVFNLIAMGAWPQGVFVFLFFVLLVHSGEKPFFSYKTR